MFLVRASPRVSGAGNEARADAVPDDHAGDGADRSEDLGPPVPLGKSRAADSGVKRGEDDSSAAGDSDPEEWIVAAQVDDFARDESDNQPNDEPADDDSDDHVVLLKD